MKLLSLILCLTIVGLLIWLNQFVMPPEAFTLGGLTWMGWTSIFGVGLVIGLFVFVTDSARALGIFKKGDGEAGALTTIRTLERGELAELGLKKYRGPVYPHPVIFPERCIGCQACVDACPHDVLAIVDGIASSVAPDLCMEDTACQAECPVNPKACIIINTTKEVRSLPTPTRDGATFQTNVPGCFIIGDVSGVPLIKNAVKEGYEVIAEIAGELKNVAAEPKAQVDVAIIGVGPGGASAASAAKEAGLTFVAIEQDKTLSTIDQYPKGKYIFFKPDTKDWFGGIPVVGLGLTKAKYAESDAGPKDQEIYDALGTELDGIVRENVSPISAALIERIPAELRPELAPLLNEKIAGELKKRVAAHLTAAGDGNWPAVFQSHFQPRRDELLTAYRSEIADQLETKIPGDQRENILRIWLSNLDSRGVTINEFESCKTVNRADDGDYFTITTEPGTEKSPRTYSARRVVIAIGLRGAPNKLRLANEELKFTIDGHEESKVIYALSDPMKFRGRNIVIVGGGNVAVEAAVDLVAVRDGANIVPRKPADMNRVTLLVRDYLAPTVKFGNKFQLFQCADSGVIDLKFGVGIKEMRENELVLEDVVSRQDAGTIPNDFVFALIGGERPNRFLESIGITIK